MLLKIPPLHVIGAKYLYTSSGMYECPTKGYYMWADEAEEYLTSDRYIELDIPDSEGDWPISRNKKGNGIKYILKDFYEFCVNYVEPGTIKHLGRPHVH